MITRDLIKTSAALMVDYSCALKLASSISVLTALKASAQLGFTVKGPKYFDAIAQADTIVFDKTGTLTEATPKLSKILAFENWSQKEALRLAACLEEHFPHPVARAVVNEAKERNIEHRERHAEVEYIVAHGIVSSLDGKRVVIGSKRFVVDDENVEVSEAHSSKINKELEDCSRLYLAIDNKLIAVLGILDPLKDGIPQTISHLKETGIKNIVMLTGDSPKSAAAIAREAGITEFQGGMLPEDKLNYVKKMTEAGKRVIMVGDGINDAPALAAASVGIAMGQGTAVAKEVADITLSTGDLESIVDLRRLSKAVLDRLNMSFKEVMVVNSSLLIAGVTGLVTPQASSLAHNASTIAISLKSAADYKLN